MYYRVFRYFVFLLILTSCAPIPSEEDVRQQEFGEIYATMGCWWSSQEEAPRAIFWCSEDLETELISGYVSLAIEEDAQEETFLSICGIDVTLNTGHDLHDILIASMTQGAYNCYNSYEKELGNEFDWLWSASESTLQLIWRPEDQDHTVLTVVIPEKEDSPNVLGTVYYKTGVFD
tara:strand:- start:4240 stop:4767 length:528 start_codon:yes stop_codon:yes gene_type:complete